MDLPEQEFWEDFLQEAEEVISQRYEEGEQKPFEPTDSLQEKYWRAVDAYDGAKRDQVQQLAAIFTFVRPASVP